MNLQASEPQRRQSILLCWEKMHFLPLAGPGMAFRRPRTRGYGLLLEGISTFSEACIKGMSKEDKMMLKFSVQGEFSNKSWALRGLHQGCRLWAWKAPWFNLGQMSPQWDPPSPPALRNIRNGTCLASEELVTWRVTQALTSPSHVIQRLALL